MLLYAHAAAATTTMQGNYYGTAPYLISPQAGLAKYANVVYEAGCNGVKCPDTSGFAGACLHVFM